MNRKQTLRLTTSLVIAVFMIMSLIGCSAPSRMRIRKFLGKLKMQNKKFPNKRNRLL